MRIFCVGLSRTGTTSLYKALKELGYRSCHFLHGGCNYVSHIEHFLHGNYDWPILQEYDAFCDIPVPALYQHWMQKDDILIYTERKIDDWLDSCEYWFNCQLPRYSFDTFTWSTADLTIDTATFIRYITYGSTVFDAGRFELEYRKNELKFIAYERHFRSLRMNICDNGDGWEKLCSFLQKDIPNEPFPIINSQNDSKILE